MGLYLVVFGDDHDDDEIEGVQVGGYDDFGEFREIVSTRLEPDGWGTRFPVLMNHVDSEGEWTPSEAAALEQELLIIGDELSRLPALPRTEGWQAEVAREAGLSPSTLLDSFFDVDGEPLVERLLDVARAAQQHNRSIWFQ